MLENEKKFISFGSIEKLESVSRDIKFISEHPYPTVKAIGSEKIHGTNGSVCFSERQGFWVQSRKRIITPNTNSEETDNQGCAQWAMENEELWTDIIRDLSVEYSIDLKKSIVTVYFEWCGGSIQSNKSAVTGMPKMAMVFQYFKVSKISELVDLEHYWEETKVGIVRLSNIENGIYNIMDFDNYEIEIDFNHVDIARAKMIDIVENKVEQNSPVGVSLGHDGNIGEGIVVQFKYNNKLYRLKTKGQKHSKSKVRKLKPVDSVKEQKKIDFANDVVQPWRLEQAWDNIFGINNELCMPSEKKTGDYIREVYTDIIKEESYKLEKLGLNIKDVNKHISDICRLWFFEQLEKER